MIYCKEKKSKQKFEKQKKKNNKKTPIYSQDA